ncbi:MAG: GlsB/YeaQ/YmgE family stress response membrane protein [Phototrophicales bacterium]|nr:MAG: GlsB/YeaQ/YmgE family stress response membrane protein [Phototrophicales bacterium]
MDTSELVALLIIGLVSGTAAASVTSGRGKRSMNDWIRNTVIGIIGAIIGKLIFDILDIGLPSFLNAAVTPADLLIAFIGALIVIFLARFIQR